MFIIHILKLWENHKQTKEKQHYHNILNISKLKIVQFQVAYTRRVVAVFTTCVNVNVTSRPQLHTI